MGTSRIRMRREPAACQRTMRTPCTCPGLQEPLSLWPSTAINLMTAAPAASASCTGVRGPLPTRRAILGHPTGTGMVYILSSKKNKAIFIYAEQRWSGDEMVLGWRHAEMVRIMAANASGGALGVVGVQFCRHWWRHWCDARQHNELVHGHREQHMPRVQPRRH
jgi:hypothetical protein